MSANLRCAAARVAAVSALAAGLFAACDESTQRATPLPDCGACLRGAGIVGAMASGAGGSAAAGGAGGGGGELLDAGVVPWTGTVALLSYPNLLPSAAPLPEAAVVSLLSEPEVKTYPDASGQFSLGPASSTPTAWALVEAATLSTLTVPTIQLLPEPGQVTLGWVSASTLTDLVASSFLVSPFAIEGDQGQVVLRFLSDRTDLPVADVSVALAGDRDGFIAYDAGEGYSDAQGATGDRGVALVMGLAAATAPDSTEVLLSYRVGTGGARSIAVRVRSGAVTWVTVHP